jgi:cytochrome P450
MRTQPSPAVATDIDLFAEGPTLDPYPVYRELRNLGPVVHLHQHDLWAVPGYAEAREVLLDPVTYTSTRGVGVTDVFNAMARGSVLVADPPQHDRMRSVLMGQLGPRRIGGLTERVRRLADRLLDEAFRDGPEADLVEGLSTRLPAWVIADLVGLPADEVECLVDGADVVFAASGPPTPFVAERAGLIEAFMAYASAIGPNDVRPGSWGAELFAAERAGRLEPGEAFPQLLAYLGAGIDTTVHGLSHLLLHVSARPDGWSRLRGNGRLAVAAFDEALRVDSPLRGFTRLTTRESSLGDVVVPAGVRVFPVLPSANRDERRYPDPDTFVLDRMPSDHLAFGTGLHGCAGQGLARMEAEAMVAAILDRARRLDIVDEPRHRYNPMLRILDSLHVRLVP